MRRSFKVALLLWVCSRQKSAAFCTHRLEAAKRMPVCSHRSHQLTLSKTRMRRICRWPGTHQVNKCRSLHLHRLRAPQNHTKTRWQIWMSRHSSEDKSIRCSQNATTNWPVRIYRRSMQVRIRPGSLIAVITLMHSHRPEDLGVFVVFAVAVRPTVPPLKKCNH